MTVDRQLTDQLTVAKACCLLAGGGGGGVEADNKRNCKSPVLLGLLFFPCLVYASLRVPIQITSCSV